MHRVRVLTVALVYTLILVLAPSEAEGSGSGRCSRCPLPPYIQTRASAQPDSVQALVELDHGPVGVFEDGGQNPLFVRLAVSFAG